MSRRLFIHFIFVFLGLLAGLWASHPRWQAWMQERRSADEQLERMRTAEAQREDLLRIRARASTRLGKETMAREHGWLKPGETPAD